VSAGSLGGLTDTELGEQLAAGNTHALEQLYDRYGTLSYSLAVRLLGDPAKAEDVVQDVFLRLWNGAGQFDTARGSLRTWVLTSIRNRAIDYLRGRGAHERREREIPEHVEAVGGGSDPWLEVAQSLEQETVRRALQALPAEQRQAIELAYFGGYTQREIAAMTRVPLSTVKGRMRLGLEKLHSYLQGKGLVDE
jgi:RNA polymerase sigma-70 factor, ECF subfamily